MEYIEPYLHKLIFKSAMYFDEDFQTKIVDILLFLFPSGYELTGLYGGRS